MNAARRRRASRPARSAARVRAAAAALALAAVSAAAWAQAPRLGAPVLDPTGVVRWVARRDPVPGWARGLVVPPGTRADSLALWRAAAGHPGLHDAALHRLALLRLATGDSTGADSCWAVAAAERSPWTWPALRGRVELALAAGAAHRADSLLERAERTGWSDADRAAWLAARVRTRAAAEDTAQAIEFARQALRAYPAQGSTSQALACLEALLRARGATLSVEDERAAAEVEAFAGRGAAAEARLRRVLADSSAGGQCEAAGLRLCGLLRGQRRFTAARGVAESVLARAVDPGLRRELRLERARAWVGAGHPDSALADYARLAADSATVAVAGWEAGRTAEDAGRWHEATGWYLRAAIAGGRRGADARFRAGLLLFAAGRSDSAAACWAGVAGEGARFWGAVACRARGDGAGADSMLREAAAAPGYTFYRAAARDTLGSAAWRDVAPARVARAGDRCEVAGAADELAAVGALDEAGMLLARLTGNAPAGTEPAGCGGTEGVLAGARSAYALGRIGLGVALARRALDLAAEGEVEGEWEVVPWGFPPAFDSLLASARDPVVATLEPALLFALAWQESRFDPRARSRSDALGLMQLKLATARDVARRAGEPEPGAASLFDAERSVRYGGRYLARLLGRCDGSVAAALCAYNAGPAALRLDWRRLRERGGEALVCELASNPLAQDYAKAILAARAAYRELRPTTTP